MLFVTLYWFVDYETHPPTTWKTIFAPSSPHLHDAGVRGFADAAVQVVADAVAAAVDPVEAVFAEPVVYGLYVWSHPELYNVVYNAGSI